MKQRGTVLEHCEVKTPEMPACAGYWIGFSKITRKLLALYIASMYNLQKGY